MTKDFLQKTKQKLEEKGASIEEELKTFATKDKKLEGDWDAVFPKSSGGTGGQMLEDAADQVEEYSNRISVEFSLETQLKDINSALQKIKKNKYGKCEQCKKTIPLERLEVYPQAKSCSKCK